MKVIDHRQERAEGARIAFEVINDQGHSIGSFAAVDHQVEAMRSKLTERVLAELQQSLQQTLRTRLGMMVAKQVVSGQRNAYSTAEHFGIVLSTADVASIADELARNSTQALLGLIDCIQEGK